MFSPGAFAGNRPEPELYLQATLIRVVDGDTIHVRLASGPIKVRLHGIDAPEASESLGAAATKFLRSELEGQSLEIEPIEQSDAYGRLVAKVLVRGDDVNARMIEAGYAWASRRYLRRQTADESYCRLEADARAAGRGIWVGAPSEWQPPWETRAQDRGEPAQDVNYAAETAAACIAAIGRPDSPARQQPGAGEPAPSGGCRIKGNINARGERIFHVPGSPSYDDTRVATAAGERWFCSVAEAERAGWRAPRQ